MHTEAADAAISTNIYISIVNAILNLYKCCRGGWEYSNIRM